MTCMELNRAFQYVEDKYLELVDEERVTSTKKMVKIPKAVVAACIIGLVILLSVPVAAIAGNWFGVKDYIIQSDFYQNLIKEKDSDEGFEMESEKTTGMDGEMTDSSEEDIMGELSSEYAAEGIFAEDSSRKSGVDPSINESNLYASLQNLFYKGEERDVIVKVNVDGSFKGTIRNRGTCDEGMGFKGQFAEPVKQSDGVFCTRVERLNWDKNTREMKEATDEKLESIGLSEGAKIRFYLPGTSLDDVDSHYLSRTDFTRNRKAVPRSLCVLYNITDDVDFAAKKEVPEHYEGKTGDYWAVWTPYYNKCYLSFSKYRLGIMDDGTESVDYIEGVGFSGEVDEDLQTDFVVKKYADDNWSAFDKNADGVEPDYKIHLEYLDEAEEEIKLTITSEDGEDFTKWGGTEDGTLTVVMKNERTPLIDVLKGTVPEKKPVEEETKDIPEEKYKAETYIPEKDLFAVLPVEFIKENDFMKENGREQLRMNINPDGTFTGEGIINLEEKNKRYLCEFNGCFSRPARLENGIYVATVQAIEWGTEHREVNVNGRKDIYEPYQVFDAMLDYTYTLLEDHEVEIYLPGTSLDITKKRFAEFFRKEYGENCNNIPENLCVIYDDYWRVGFYAEAQSMDYGHYETKQGDVNVMMDILPSKINLNLFTDEERNQYIYHAYIDSRRMEIDEKYGYTLSGEITERDQTDLIMKKIVEKSGADSPGGICKMHIEYPDDEKKTVRITLTCENGGDLSAWGGTEDGTFTAELQLDSKRNFHHSK